MIARVPELEVPAIRAAHAQIQPAFRNTPQYVHEGLSARLGVAVIVKIETANPVRSFKGRGTWVAIQALARDGSIGRQRAVVCASAGNFGQGVAFAARALDVPATVFCSTRANRAKVARMRALGANVIEVGDDFDAARASSEDHARRGGATLLVDGEDPRISTGAATIALELTDAVAAGDLPAPAVVSVPVGNGALLNGLGSWLKATAPACRIVGVQAEGAAAMTNSWRFGRPVDTETALTYADGIASRVAIPRAVELMQ
nr:pyridoxal-phosphate dependent enzyme [Chloroflexota bacterium]